MTQVNEKDLLKSSYAYHLPEELIAQRPVEPRDHSRLLIFDQATNKVTHALLRT
jgi:S-adenosylmethionine:tRNA ribosyltransferase-isomerase